ncbi:hypothetical protein FVER14953_21317 [Fusarium verticillioides]|nr:hypothetical protein FVER14953_21317 [Fusarium verticillioides]
MWPVISGALDPTYTVTTVTPSLDNDQVTGCVDINAA